MVTKINQKISVLTIFNADTNNIAPHMLKWNNRKYPITQVGLHHTIHLGKTLHHIFSVTSGTTYFRLNLNTDNLHWILEEIESGDG
jgi:hypothetical protein